jgi:myo-inositol-1(or 4)-monophosphatase
MRSPLITIMSNAAIKASKRLIRDFGEIDQLQISRKGTSNFVTQTDVQTEKLLHGELKRARPEYGFLMEESGELPGVNDEFRWIIDPLDGTSNFIHAVSYFCISLALERTIRKGVTEIVAGVIFDPVHNELFAAEKEKGATLNDRRIQVSRREHFEGAMLVTGNPRHAATHDDAFAALKRVSNSAACVRYSGASALDLAYVAAGRYDGVWFHSVQPWDVAAGMLLVQEAGGLSSSFSGGPASIYDGTLAAGNRTLQVRRQKTNFQRIEFGSDQLGTQCIARTACSSPSSPPRRSA